MRRKSARHVLVAIAAVGAAGGAACSRYAPQASTSSDVPTVAVAKITRGDLAQELTIAAEFRPFQEIDVHAKVAGYVKNIGVDVGDRVRAGQLLAVLEVPELQDELRQDQAAVRRAQEEVNRASADLERAESAHQVAHLAATRLAGVLKARPNLVAQQDIDDATGRDRVAEAQTSTAKAAIAAAQQQLEVSKASENKTRTLLAYTQITAPFAGVITHRYADTGAMIQAGTSSQTQTMPVVKLSQNNVLRLVIPVPESAVPSVHLNAPVKVAVQALHQSLTGTVARFADRLDADTRTMRVEVDVPNPTLTLVPGMYANVSLVLDRASGVLIAPIEAVARGEGGATLMVVKDDRHVQPVKVTLGLESADRVEVKGDVAADELVVIGNRAQLRAGTAVVPKLIGRSDPEGSN
ncbi:MAG TPA: efflux RND transporter periplasmic adaptor subunit [Vicinamibacterales bacterium]